MTRSLLRPPPRSTKARKILAEGLRERYIGQAKIFAFIAVTSIYLALLYFGTAIVLPSQTNDANTIAQLSVSLDEVDSFDGYAVMAFIYSLTSNTTRYLIVILFSAMFFYNVLKWCRGVVSISVASFLCLAPILLFLCFFVKDTFYLPFMLATLWIMTNIRSNVAVSLISAALILIYAFLFRQYFIIIATLFLALFIFKKINWTSRIVIVLLVPIVLYFLPKELYVTLQEQRDIVNQYRVGFSGSGNRTLFLNYMPPDGLYSFLVNYGYAFARLNFPVFFGGGAKEAFLMVNVFLYGWLLWLALRSRDIRVWRPGLLFAAHFLTLLLFEPDLGSYLRHIGTSLPLLAPAFGAWDWRKNAIPKARPAASRRNGILPSAASSAGSVPVIRAAKRGRI